MNLFITKMGVLATAEVDRKTLMKVISKAKEYGALSEEIGKIYYLMEYWDFDLPKAARQLPA
jgi:flagellar protein FlaJ